MAKRNVPIHLKVEPTKLIVGRDFFKEQLEDRVRAGEQLAKRQIQTYEQLDQAKNDYYSWNDYNSELLKQSFNNEDNEYRKSYGKTNWFPFTSGPQDKLKQFKEDLNGKIEELKQLISKIPLLKTDIEGQNLTTLIANPDSKPNQDIFIVHGHNNEIKVNVARTLEKIGLNPIILHEQPNNGKTIIEKFEAYSNVGFAIVLLTDDDDGKAKKEDEYKARARQNVILELGYFIGRLGRDKVCPLYTKGVELPTDISGVLYIELDQGETWKIKIIQELRAAGYSVDSNKVF